MTQREAFETWAKSLSLDTDHKEKDAWGREQYSPHIHSMWQGWQAAQAQAAAPDWLLKSTQDLCLSLAKRVYPEVTGFQVLDDLAGVISQVDNITCGMERKREAAVEPVGWFIDVTTDGNSTGDYQVAAREHWGDRSVCVPLYTSPPDHTDAMEALRKANLDCVDHFDALNDDYDKARDAMRLALEAMARYQRKRDDWDTFADAIAALEKEIGDA